MYYIFESDSLETIKEYYLYDAITKHNTLKAKDENCYPMIESLRINFDADCKYSKYVLNLNVKNRTTTSVGNIIDLVYNVVAVE